MTTRIHSDLPIFRLDRETDCVLYTPGHAVVSSFSAVTETARLLEPHASKAVERWRQLTERPFEPECLTVYLSNRCDLGCTYCFAASADGKRKSIPLAGEAQLPIIREDVVRSAAQLVARNCVAKQKAFTLVAHGGGEPTLHMDVLERIVGDTQEVARHSGIGWWSYIATHGAIPPEKAAWLARNFNLIGLSCDGPPDIQNAQRPGPGDTSNALAIEQTARLFRSMGAPFTVRATITRDTMHRQAEIVEYLHAKLGASEIRFEPAYYTKGRQPGFSAEDADAFVRHFLDAQSTAASLRCSLKLSGVRLDEIHGPYCNVLRDVLHLTPDGFATACFLCTDGTSPENSKMAIGRMDAATGEFVVDYQRAAAIRNRASIIPRRCQNCVNVFHCVRECPEVCPAIGEEDIPEREGGFRCRVQKQLAETWLLQFGYQ